MLVAKGSLVNSASAAFLRMGASPSIPHHIAERGGGSTNNRVERPACGANLLLTSLLLIDVQRRSINPGHTSANTEVSARNLHLVWHDSANSVTSRPFRLTKEKEMRRLSITLLTLLALASVTLFVALAQSPHFLKASFGTLSNTTGCVDVNFKAAGFGNEATTGSVKITATVSATWACKNRGQQCPNAANKQTTTETIDVTKSFAVRNGQITDSFTICPSNPGNFCPGGQTVVLDSVTYTNVRLTIPDTGDIIVVGDKQSGDLFPNCP